MKKKDLKLVVWIIIASWIAYILAYIFLRFIQYPDKPFEIDIAIISAFPTLLIVVATLTYVVITSKIFEESQLDRRKSFIEQMIKKIIFPLLDRIKHELKEFQTKSIYFVKNQKCDLNCYCLKKFVFHKHADVFYKIFEENYPELSKKIRRYDSKLPEINESINNLVTKISTKEFWNKWTEKIDSYEKNVKGREKRFPSYGSREQQSALIDCILNSVLQETKFHDIPDPFWTKHYKEILSERKHNKKEFEYVESKTKEMISSLAELIEDMEKTIISEQEKYGILAYD